ncbi:MAG: hypothetical protein HGA85_03700 [Nanoarchaeota archaeon]|nr:hypothetical protein [Nanoarchaeota archaeon]
MEIINLFGVAGLIILVGFIGEWIFEKTNIPDALFLLLLGIILGQFAGSENIELLYKFGPIFTTFALIFILFEGVLSTDIKKLAGGIAEGTSLAFLNLLLSFFVVSITMTIAGWPFWESLMLGAILADSAQAVIIPLMKKIKIGSQALIALTFESAISDVFTIVGTLTIINIILMKSFSLSSVLQTVIYSFVFAIIAGAVAAFIWVKVLPFLDRFSKSYMTTIAVVLLLYAGVESLKANGALACLTFGLIVGNSSKIYHLIKKESDYHMASSAKFFYSEISFFLKTFFFVYLGLIIDLKETKLMLLGALLASLLFFARPIAVFLSHRNAKVEPKDIVDMQILNPKGLSAAVLAQVPMQYGLGKGFPTVVLSAIVTSILLMILFVFLSEKGIYKGILVPKHLIGGKQGSAKHL